MMYRRSRERQNKNSAFFQSMRNAPRGGGGTNKQTNKQTVVHKKTKIMARRTHEKLLLRDQHHHHPKGENHYSPPPTPRRYIIFNGRFWPTGVRFYPSNSIYTTKPNVVAETFFKRTLMFIVRLGINTLTQFLRYFHFGNK